MSENRGSGLISGLIFGTAIGAGAVFLFGTKKGKEIRNKVRDDYPELFDKVDDFVDDTKDELSDKYNVVADKVKGVAKHASKKT